MIVGVDLGGTQIRAGVYNQEKIVEKTKAFLSDKENFKSTLSQLKNVITPLIKSRTKGIGIGVPSVVDVNYGVVYNVVNIPSWKEVKLKAILEYTYNVPVHVNNDANCFTYGVYIQNEFKKFDNLIGVTLGTGIGTGLILNKQPYFGKNCSAGELGMLPYKEKTYELYGSSQFFEFEYGISAKKLNELAEQGDQKALDTWQVYSRHLGQYIKVLLAAYNPDAIVFGGSIANAFPFFYVALKDALKDFEFSSSVQHVQLFQNKDEDAALIGAAELFKKYSL